jgi:hypothetical protein
MRNGESGYGMHPKTALTVSSDLPTSLEIQGNRAIYEVRTRNPLYQDRLVHMGFTSEQDSRFTRSLSNAGDVSAIHRRFAEHLEEMLLQSARLRPVRWVETLGLILKRLDGTSLQWFLYGSAALALRGIEVQPGDLDLWVSDARLAGQIFEDLLVEPVTTMTGWVADFGGRAFAGCLFEWLAAVHPDVEELSPHEQGAAARASLEFVNWHGYSVPVSPLALQLSVAERRGLTGRAASIHSYMNSRSAFFGEHNR